MKCRLLTHHQVLWKNQLKILAIISLITRCYSWKRTFEALQKDIRLTKYTLVLWWESSDRYKNRPQESNMAHAISMLWCEKSNSNIWKYMYNKWPVITPHVSHSVASPALRLKKKWLYPPDKLTFIQWRHSDFGNILNFTNSPIKRTVFSLDSMFIWSFFFTCERNIVF